MRRPGHGVRSRTSRASRSPSPSKLKAVVAIMTNDAPPPGAALVVRPGDVLVVLMPRNANPADVDPIARQWHESYPDTPVRFMIGPEQIAVMRKGVDWCIDCNRPAAECACPS